MKKPFNYFEHWKQFVNDASTGKLTIEEYDKACSKADWFYYMSDMNLSPVAMNSINEAAEFNDAFKRIYNREHAKRFNNESFYPADDTSRKYEYPFKLKQPLPA